MTPVYKMLLKWGKNGILSTPSDVSSAFLSDGSDGSADGVDKCSQKVNRKAMDNAIMRLYKQAININT